MAGYKYSSVYDKEIMAKAVGRAVPVSKKQCVEICRWLKGRKIFTAKKMLSELISMKRPVPFKQFMHKIPHRKAIGPGRYPVKSGKEILKIIESAEVNAQFKGLDVNELVIRHISAQKAHTPWHLGRQRRRKAKRAHIEVIVAPLQKPEENKGKK